MTSVFSVVNSSGFGFRKAGSIHPRCRFFTSTPIEISDPASMSVMRVAANNFGCPAE